MAARHDSGGAPQKRFLIKSPRKNSPGASVADDGAAEKLLQGGWLGRGFGRRPAGGDAGGAVDLGACGREVLSGLSKGVKRVGRH